MPIAFPAGQGRIAAAERRGGSRLPAFTLTELLVSIAVVDVLIGLAIPGLSAARAVARRTASASNLRQIHAVLLLYAGDSAQSYPAIEEGRLYPVGPPTLRIALPYWQVFQTWPGVIYDYLPVHENARVYLSPGVGRRDPDRLSGWPPSYFMSNTLAGDAALWESGPAYHAGMRRARRTDEVLFPAAKALMFDSDLGWLTRPRRYPDKDLAESTPVLFADGSVSTRIPVEASGPFPNRDPDAMAEDLRIINTPSGVRGRDY
jgi:type II secretory pathway pseudopilin PulG